MNAPTYTVEATFAPAGVMRWHTDKATRQDTEAFAESLTVRNWSNPLLSVRAINADGAEVWYWEA